MLLYVELWKHLGLVLIHVFIMLVDCVVTLLNNQRIVYFYFFYYPLRCRRCGLRSFLINNPQKRLLRLQLGVRLVRTAKLRQLNHCDLLPPHLPGLAVVHSFDVLE